MEKKYYDLIISIIKQHRKYPEYEAILEDIAEDVYEHSKVVISSVANDDVISAYLSKVVATSMITVPKKLNYNTRVKHRVILPTLPEPATSISEQATTTFGVEQDLEAETPVEAESIIVEPEVSTEELAIQDDLSFEEELFAEEDSSEAVSDNDDKMLVETMPEEESLELSIPEEPVFEQDVPLEIEEEIIEPVADLEEEKITSSIGDVDKNLVDMMINGVSETVEDDIVSEEFMDIEEMSSDNDEYLEDIDSMILEENSVMEENPEQEEVAEPLESPDESVALDDIEEEVVLEPEEEINDSQSMSVESLDLDENTSAFDIADMAESAEVESIETLDTMDDELQPSELDVPIEDLALETNELPSLDFDTENLETLDEEVSCSSNTLTLPNFDCFSFEPKKIDYDAEQIKFYLEEINEKHPEKHILEICDLKYNQNLSVQEISEKIDLSKEVVLEVLSEIIDTVKD